MNFSICFRKDEKDVSKRIVEKEPFDFGYLLPIHRGLFDDYNVLDNGKISVNFPPSFLINFLGSRSLIFMLF
jgi:hypothetical protein